MDQSLDRDLGSMQNDEAFDALTLSFINKETEQAFREEYLTSSKPQIRLGLLLGCFLYAVFGMLDGHLIPETKHAAWLIRYGLVCPMIISCIIFSYSTQFHKYFEVVVTLVGAVAGIAVITIIALAEAPGSYMYYAGVLMCTIFYFTFMGLRFVTATCLGWFIFLLYEFVAFNFTDIPGAYFINNSAVLLTFTICGMTICYTIEKYRRNSFLQSAVTAKHTETLQKTLENLEENALRKGDVSRDPFTKLFSRNYFLSVAEYESNKYSRVGHQFSILLLDIDNLQLISDSFGQRVAESVIAAAGRRLTTYLRPYDVPCRYSESRFAILLPETQLDDAKTLAARIRQDLDKVCMTTEKGPLSITITTGIAGSLDRSGNSVSTMLDNAAAALLQAKQNGRKLDPVETFRSAS